MAKDKKKAREDEDLHDEDALDEDNLDEEDEDLEDEEEDEEGEDEGEEDEEPDEEADEEEEHGEDEEEYEDDEDEYEDEDEEAALAAPDRSEDPFWWTPHLVLGVLLTISLLGFFGFFNDYLGFLAAHPADHEPEPAATAQAQAPQPEPQPRTPAQRPTAPEGEIYGARHVLVQYKGSRRAGPDIERSKEEAKKRAEEIAAKASKLAKEKKEDELVKEFGELAKEFSDEPGADKRGGDLGRFRKGSMVQEFQQAVEKLKKGEVSGVVETPFGYHVILRTM